MEPVTTLYHIKNQKLMTPLIATLIGILTLLIIFPLGWIRDNHEDRKQLVETTTDYDGMGTYCRYMRR